MVDLVDGFGGPWAIYFSTNEMYCRTQCSVPWLIITRQLWAEVAWNLLDNVGVGVPVPLRHSRFTAPLARDFSVPTRGLATVTSTSTPAYRRALDPECVSILSPLWSLLAQLNVCGRLSPSYLIPSPKCNSVDLVEHIQKNIIAI